MIDLFGGLKLDKVERRSATRTDLLTGRAMGARRQSARVVFEFSAPDLVFNADEKVIAAEVATAIADTIRESLLGGQQVDGSPLPAASAKTIENRRARVAQSTGGASRYTDPKLRARAAKNYDKRFKAAKLGMQTPMAGETRFGLESGLLARSIVAAPTAGGTWQVYFAAIRAKLDRSGSSAALRVFKRVRFWSNSAMSSERVQAALRRCQAGLMGKRALVVFQQIQRTAELVQRAAQEESP